MLILAQNPRVLITTFGDMVRVPGSTGSLQEMAAQGANVRIIYSPLDAIALAQNNPNKEVVFLAVGFETTAPTVAMALEQAQKLGLENFSIVCLHKLVIPALIAPLEDPEIQVQGFYVRVMSVRLSALILMNLFRKNTLVVVWFPVLSRKIF